jgi:predicted nuclease of predicted toxin-antitoxin system
MKALLDMPVSFSLISVLEAYSHEGVHASEVGLSNSSDTQLLAHARETGSIIVTADLDFPRLLALSQAAGPGIILFRGGNYSDAEMRDLLTRVLQTIPIETIQTSICVVDKTRIRVTHLPIARKRNP